MRRREKGNLMMILAVTGFISVVASSIAMISFFTINQASRENEYHQIRLTAISALNQCLYRIKRQEYSEKKAPYLLTGKEWENIILNSENGQFNFDKSFDPNFSIENGCKSSISFTGPSDCISVYNFSSTSPVSIAGRKFKTPPNSVDLIIKSSGKYQSKRFEAVIEKIWPYAISSGSYAIDVGRSAEITGDIYSSSKMQVNNPYPTSCFVRLAKERASGTYPIVKGNLYGFNKNKENPFLFKIDLPTNPQIENFRKEISFAIDPFATFKGQKYITNQQMKDFSYDDFAKLKGNAEDITDELISSGIIQEIDDDLLKSFKKYVAPVHFNEFESYYEQIHNKKKIYLIKKDICLSGTSEKIFNNFNNSNTFNKSSSNSYIFNGTLVAFPDISIKEAGTFIECLSCNLFVDGDLLLLKYSDMYYETQAKCAFQIPSIKGTNASVCVCGNIYASGGMLESPSDKFVIYSDENIYFRPFFNREKTQSIFKGAIVCRKHLTINPPEEKAGYECEKSIWIKGAIICGNHKPETAINPFNNQSDNRSSGKILIENARIDYDPDTISLIHKLIGVADLSIWREL